MNTERLKELYSKYNLTKDDVFKHDHYIIITRQGIDKIQAIEGIEINYDVINSEPDFAVVKATALKEYHTEKGHRKEITLQTFGSAKHGSRQTGNTISWYIMEMAEKRAMSRIVLKMTGFYELGVFGEDESEDFKRK